MKYFYLPMLAVLCIFPSIYSQELKPVVFDPPIEIEYTDWSADILLSASEPLGKLSGIRKNSNNTIYIAVPDTNNVIANSCLVIFGSSNGGANWSAVAGVAPGTSKVTRTRMVRNGQDSIYCFFQVGTSLYCWNVLTNFFNQFLLGAPVRDFDAAGSSTGALYLFIDEWGDNDIYRYGSVNSGMSWGNSGWVANNGAHPRVYMSGTGDTVSLNYRITPFTADTTASNLFGVRYRQTSSGAMSIIDFFIYVQNTIPKPDFQSVFYSGKLWFFWSEGVPGNVNLKGMVSTNSGQLFGSVFNVANTSADEYWFEARHSNDGVHLAYFHDSAGTSSDKMNYTFAALAAPSVFTTPFSFSEHVPVTSTHGYRPAMVELGGGSVGVAWVGLDGSAPKVYWDYNILVGIKNENEIASGYTLSQNYPNPFNPVTTIAFTLPKDEFVTMKIFDIQGREAAIIISKDMKRGAYEVTFDASHLSSGLYFYKLETASFTDTKKMLLIK